MMQGLQRMIFAAFVKMLRDRDIEDLDHLNELSTMDAQTIMKLPTNHVIILAKMTWDVSTCTVWSAGPIWIIIPDVPVSQRAFWTSTEKVC